MWFVPTPPLSTQFFCESVGCGNDPAKAPRLVKPDVSLGEDQLRDFQNPTRNKNGKPFLQNEIGRFKMLRALVSAGVPCVARLMEQCLLLGSMHDTHTLPFR